MENKVCFVIMGFGKKKDPISNRTIDLDTTYKKIIKPAVVKSGYTCIRADEISDSGLIDKSMYALLYRAELVIADISTYNPNAIYELGVRHTLKPFSTIIIKEDEVKIPFDLDHNRTLSYKHLGNEISEDEAKIATTNLFTLINSITQEQAIDSPLYTFIPETKKPTISDEIIHSIIGELEKKENTIYSLLQSAKDLMGSNQFRDAAKKWNKLSHIVENEDFFIQQEALCIYKSKSPSPISALTDALKVIDKLSHKNDTETLGITGAINKHLWFETKEIAYLNVATEYYQKGWNIYKDYYTGENFASCIEQKYQFEVDPDMKVYNKVQAKLVREEIIKILLNSFEDEDVEELKWKYATLANCYLSLGKTDEAKKYNVLFLDQNPLEWEVNSYNESREQVREYYEKSNRISQVE